jgi:beta-glucanase (GH16 family)
LTGLLPATTYDLQIVASNNYGQTVSSTLTVSTALFFDDFTTFSLSNYFTGATGNWQLGGRSYQTAGYSEGLVWEANPFNPATPITLATVANSICTMIQEVTPTAYAAACGNQPYVAAWMSTRGTQYFQWGYFEARIATALVPGVGCSFWLLAESGNWPPEIDIAEFTYTPVAVGGQVVAHNVWNIPTSTGLCSWYCYSGGTGSNGLPSTALVQTSYHQYGVNVQSDFITFYIDRVQTDQIATPTGYSTNPLYMVLSIGSFGGTYEGPVNPAQLPCSMLVDYVGVWSQRPF